MAKIKAGDKVTIEAKVTSVDDNRLLGASNATLTFRLNGLPITLRQDDPAIVFVEPKKGKTTS